MWYRLSICEEKRDKRRKKGREKESAEITWKKEDRRWWRKEKITIWVRNTMDDTWQLPSPCTLCSTSSYSFNLKDDKWTLNNSRRKRFAWKTNGAEIILLYASNLACYGNAKPKRHLMTNRANDKFNTSKHTVEHNSSSNSLRNEAKGLTFLSAFHGP